MIMDILLFCCHGIWRPNVSNPDVTHLKYGLSSKAYSIEKTTKTTSTDPYGYIMQPTHNPLQEIKMGPVLRANKIKQLQN